VRRTSHDENGRFGWIAEGELLMLQKSCQSPDDFAKIEAVQIQTSRGHHPRTEKVSQFLEI
jgi:hypothetical protein